MCNTALAVKVLTDFVEPVKDDLLDLRSGEYSSLILSTAEVSAIRILLKSYKEIHMYVKTGEDI